MGFCPVCDCVICVCDPKYTRDWERSSNNNAPPTDERSNTMPGSNDPNFDAYNAKQSEAATADTSATDAALKSLGAKIEALQNTDSEAHPHTHSADLRSFTQVEISNWFSYHAPTPEQIIQYGEIRTAAKIFAETINRHVPAGADKTAAMRDLRKTVMAANLAIACYVEPVKNV
jgi:hypothetical protein